MKLTARELPITATTSEMKGVPSGVGMRAKMPGKKPSRVSSPANRNPFTSAWFSE